MTDFTSMEAEAFEEHNTKKLEAEAAADAKREADHAAYLAAEQVKRIEENKSRAVHLHKIAEQVRTLRKQVAVVNEEEFDLIIDGISTKWNYDIKQEWSTGHGRFGLGSKPTGKFRFSVGQYGKRQSYPQRKDGTFNYEDIAYALSNYASAKNEEERRSKQQALNSSEVIKLQRELFPNAEMLHAFLPVVASSDPTKPVWFKFEINKTMTADEARIVAKALRAAGIKLHYSDKE